MPRVPLSDGREIAVPAERFPRLRDASPDQRGNWRSIGKGVGIHWPDIDEASEYRDCWSLEPYRIHPHLRPRHLLGRHVAHRDGQPDSSRERGRRWQLIAGNQQW